MESIYKITIIISILLYFVLMALLSKTSIVLFLFYGMILSGLELFLIYHIIENWEHNEKNK